MSDPAHPVPYRHRPIQATDVPGGSGWSTWLVESQRFVDGRPDVLGRAEYRFSLHTQDDAFRKGHRTIVQVQSSWFPLIDRNPRTFAPNIVEAADADLRTATQRIHRSASDPAHIALPARSRRIPVLFLHRIFTIRK